MLLDLRQMLYQDTTMTRGQAETRLTGDLAGRANRGFPMRDFDHTPMVEARHRPVAYVNGGRWVADCVCNGGIACWPAANEVACLDCGRIYRNVDYPTPGQIAEAETILGERQSPYNRNWDRHRGETLGDLRSENQAMGRGRP